MDFVFTVCDDAAGEVCPVWPGQPMTAHWGIEDPAKFVGSEIEKEAAFVKAFRYLKNRISVFLNLPVASLDRMALTRRLRRSVALKAPRSRRRRGGRHPRRPPWERRPSAGGPSPNFSAPGCSSPP